MLSIAYLIVFFFSPTPDCCMICILSLVILFEGMVLGEILTGPLENNLKMNTVNQQKNAKRAPILTSEDVEEVEENRNLEGDVHMNSHHANGGMNVHMHLNHPTSTYGSRPMMQGVTVPMGSQMIMSNTRPMGLSMPMGTQMRIPMSMSMEENMPFMNGPQRHRHGLQQAGMLVRNYTVICTP